ncbi:MAG: MotA/TolQ/ExbB proton channel family protein, partial [Deltaproteobacteria bacterium]
MFDLLGIIIKGGPVMAPLLVCSIIALAVVIERFLFWRRISSRQAVEEMLDLVERGEIAKASSLGNQADTPL